MSDRWRASPTQAAAMTRPALGERVSRVVVACETGTVMRAPEGSSGAGRSVGAGRSAGAGRSGRAGRPLGAELAEVPPEAGHHLQRLPDQRCGQVLVGGVLGAA